MVAVVVFMSLAPYASVTVAVHVSVSPTDAMDGLSVISASLPTTEFAMVHSYVGAKDSPSLSVTPAEHVMVPSAKGVVLSMVMESTEGARLSIVFVVLSDVLPPSESVAEAVQVLSLIHI